MKRDWYTLATWLMWLVLPMSALNYSTAWDQLPARMAVHFDANWQPNGYTSREGAVMLGLGVGGVFGLAVALVADALPSFARPKALGLLQALSAVGNVTAGMCAMAVSGVDP